MNIKITHSWLLEHLNTDATPQEIQKYLSLCGPSVERLEEVDGDIVYDIEITTNRVDTASVLGVAREAQAILPMFQKKATLNPLRLPTNTQSSAQHVPLKIIDKDNVCRRVLGVVLEVPQGAQPSPEYLTKRLTACGVRSLNNLVDITNYVMLEVGHPTHVFDYDRIQTHTLILRRAKKGERIVTLDEKEYALDEADIIIDDGTGRVIDLPGIMGTANSVVTPDTKRILFFIESNDPVSIRRTSMRYGIRTTASSINEKNPDTELALTALLRGMYLYQTIAGAIQSSQIVDIYPVKSKKTVIQTTMGFIHSRVGVKIPNETILSILKNLHFEVAVQNHDDLTITVPSHRISDVSIPEDIVEEVSRVYGYFAIPAELQEPKYVAQPHTTEALFTYQYSAKVFLKHAGFHEVMNYSAVSLELLQRFGDSEKSHLYITNSISEEIKFLRQSLIPSLIKNVSQNSGFTSDIRMFELAKSYFPTKNDLPDERFMLAVISTVSLDDIKSAVCGLLTELNIPYTLAQKSDNRYLLDSASGTIISNTRKIGDFGQVKVIYASAVGVSAPVYVAELEFEPIMLSARQMPTYRPFSQYAIVSQDVTVKKNIEYASMVQAMFKVSKLLESCSVKDMYKDTITLHLQFTDRTKNISVAEVKLELDKIKSVLQFE